MSIGHGSGGPTDILDWKLQIFTKSRAITKPILNESTSETPGAQLHMLTNIPVKFPASSLNTFGATCDTKFLDEQTDGRKKGQADKGKSKCFPSQSGGIKSTYMYSTYYINSIRVQNIPSLGSQNFVQ